MKIKSKSVYIAAVLALSIFLVQEFLWDGAGETKPSKSHDYSYQINHWATLINKSLRDLKYINDKGSLYHSDIYYDKELFLSFRAAERATKELLEVLWFNSDTTNNLYYDMSVMIKYGFENSDEAIELSKEVQKNNFLKKEFETRKKEFYQITSRLESSFEKYDSFKSGNKLVTDDDKELLAKIFSGSLLLSTYSEESRSFMHEFAVQPAIFLDIYNKVTVRYNKRVSKVENYKKLVISLLTFLSIIVAVYIERREEKI